jgi:hypothetical protein
MLNNKLLTPNNFPYHAVKNIVGAGNHNERGKKHSVLKRALNKYTI